MTSQELPHLPLKMRHTATYTSDKRKGGYLVRVQGPEASLFAGREVPVTLRSGSMHREHLDRLIWSGTDKESGQSVALYTFLARPRENVEVQF